MTTFVDDYEETRKRIALEQAMTRQAELILSMLGANLPVLIRPHVVLKKADTASTDAKHYINMPPDYNGIPTMEPEFVWARTALLAHELSHWLQPCDEIEQVEKDTGLSHDFANVVMDIQGEALIASLLPYYNDHLTKLRRHTSLKNRKDYEVDARKSVKADNFFGTIMSLAMLGRFVLYPASSFYEDYLSMSVRQLHGSLYPYGKNHKDASRVDSLLMRMNKARDIATIDLPEFLREIAKDYPELCTQEKAPFPIPQDGHGGIPIPSGLLDEFKKHKPRRPHISFWEGDALGHRPASLEEGKRANAMQLHFSTPRGGLKIMAPGEFDRMAALAGSPMPWTMTIQDDAGKTAMSDVLVAVDISGSMRGSFDGKDVNNEKWDTAISAARSITLAVKSAGGDVRGLIFDDQVWYTKGYESKVFFATSVAGLSLLKPNNMTSFEWLPYLWQKFPDHRVVIITDGGEPSDLSGIHHIPKRQKARTSAIVIPRGDAENMKRVAANVIEVRSLDLLAGAMTSVLPRRTM
jgi:hypothetical protein